jgi:hypothetical protein
LARAAVLCSQGVNLGVAEADALHPFNEGLQTRRDAEARLMRAVVGVTAEEVLETGLALVQAKLEVDLGHRQLVKVSVEDALVYG